MRNIGVVHSIPCVKWLPVLPTKLAYALTRNVLKQRSKLNQVSLKLFQHDALRLHESDLVLRGKPQWRDADFKSDTFQLPESATFLAAMDNSLPCIDRHLYCPYGCAYGQNTLGRNLAGTNGTRWNRLRCIGCTITSSSKYWKCRCQRPWHQCELHSQAHLHGRQEAPPPRHATKRKRSYTPHAPAPYPSPVLRKLAKTTHRAAPPEHVPTFSHGLPIPQRLSLGPVLAARFPQYAK